MLDKRLRGLINRKFSNKAWEEWRNIAVTKKGHLRPKLGSHYSELDEFIAQIKQVFAEEGFTNNNIYATRPISKAQLLDEIDNPVMTGQEWLDRFIKELWVPPKQERIKSDDDGESHDRFYRAGGEQFMYQRALEAARKASGVEK